jgi:hypothetical protein
MNNIRTNFEILPNNKGLRIHVTPEEQKELQLAREQEPEYFNSEDCESDVLEHVVANGLSWTSSRYTADLTEAPMLCEAILDDGTPSGNYWAYIDYVVRYVQEDLAENGESLWVHGGTLSW